MQEPNSLPRVGLIWESVVMPGRSYGHWRWSRVRSASSKHLVLPPEKDLVHTSSNLSYLAANPTVDPGHPQRHTRMTPSRFWGLPAGSRRLSSRSSTRGGVLLKACDKSGASATLGGPFDTGPRHKKSRKNSLWYALRQLLPKLGAFEALARRADALP